MKFGVACAVGGLAYAGYKLTADYFRFMFGDGLVAAINRARNGEQVRRRGPCVPVGVRRGVFVFTVVCVCVCVCVCGCVWLFGS